MTVKVPLQLVTNLTPIGSYGLGPTSMSARAFPTPPQAPSTVASLPLWKGPHLVAPPRESRIQFSSPFIGAVLPCSSRP